LICLIAFLFIDYIKKKNRNVAPQTTLKEMEPVTCNENGMIGYLNINGELRQVNDKNIMRSWMGADIDLSKIKTLNCTNMKKGTPLQLKNPPLLLDQDPLNCINENTSLDYVVLQNIIRPWPGISKFVPPGGMKQVDCTFLQKGPSVY
jgi:hypothetical protein